MAELYVGLMSGTSLDAIDCVIVDFENGIELKAAQSFPLSKQRRQEILDLCSPGENEINRMGILDRLLGKDFALAVTTTLTRASIDASSITAIGSHGQTIRHNPNSINDPSFTLQIGDPNTIALETGIDTVADFRRKDIAAGGQGAPLVPAFHSAVFADKAPNAALLNIGGMANVSLLEPPLLGYDTGPGNVLIDSYCLKLFSRNYDDGGRIAASGKINNTLLSDLLSHPFIDKQAPKSCGREEFNDEWCSPILAKYQLEPADIICTLTEFTALSVVRGLALSGRTIEEIIVCGGGAFNQHLLARIAYHSNKRITSSEHYGLAPQWMEAIAFAWFAQRTLKKEYSNAPSVTGASKQLVLGGIYYAR